MHQSASEPTDAKPVLALDVDGVVLDYVAGIAAYASAQGHAVEGDPREILEWSLSGLLPSTTQAERDALIAAFSLTEEFGALAACEGALEALAAIRSALPGIRIFAITSAGHEAETARLRRSNLEPCGFDEVMVLPVGASKLDRLRSLPPGSVFVDDLVHHVTDAESVGVAGVLFRRSYNVADAHERTVSDWVELVDVVVGALSPSFPPSTGTEPSRRVAGSEGRPGDDAT